MDAAVDAESLRRGEPAGPVGFSVGGDHPLVDPPGRLDLDVLLAREQGLSPQLLPLGQQSGPGVQGSACRVERVARTAAVTLNVLLDPAPAAVQGVTGQAHHMKGSMTATAWGSSSAVAVLKPVNPSIATTSTASRRDCSRSLSQVLNACLERPSTMSSSRAGPVADHGQIDDHGDVLVPTPRVPPEMLINPNRGAPPEPGRVVDQDPLAPREDRVVGGVPGDPEPLGDPRDGQVLTDDPLQRPPQPAPGELRPRLGRPSHVLAPHVPAPGAPVATDRHLQRGRAPAERLVSQAPHDGVTHSALAAAPATPLVGIDHPVRQHRPVGLKSLAGDLEAELIETAERVRSAQPKVASGMSRSSGRTA